MEVLERLVLTYLGNLHCMKMFFDVQKIKNHEAGYLRKFFHRLCCGLLGEAEPGICHWSVRTRRSLK